MEFLRPYLPSEGTVAELGCGSARLLARIGRERPGLKLVAVDYEETAVELAAASAGGAATDGVRTPRVADNGATMTATMNTVEIATPMSEAGRVSRLGRSAGPTCCPTNHQPKTRAGQIATKAMEYETSPSVGESMLAQR